MDDVSSAIRSIRIKHARTGTSVIRKSILQNPHYRISADGPSHAAAGAKNQSQIEKFHKTLPDYAETPLVELPGIAKELGVGRVFLKDEARRFGLPSFKILGASWAVYCAVCERVGLPLPSEAHDASSEEINGSDGLVPLRDLGDRARETGVQLVSCSAGNWGRAVARMGCLLGIDVIVYLPADTAEDTKRLIKGEGDVVTVRTGRGDYDASISEAMEFAKDDQRRLFVMDTSWEGYERIPRWVTAGYSTMLSEIDRQVSKACDKSATTVIVSVGVGSWAHSVVEHYATFDPGPTIVAVEPESGPCLMESLCCGEIVPIQTGNTIMPGMNCGTVSSIAWPYLKTGVCHSVVVDDLESHLNVQHLNAMGTNVGPCGAATLAAARKLKAAGLLVPDADAVLILVSTEGPRKYEAPKIV